MTKVAESVDRQPNLADSPFTHEGFVSSTAAADITGSGRAAVTHLGDSEPVQAPGCVRRRRL
ncbi:MspA family porin [Nocardia sp. GAS34]|uniref:MspA family porin n=1 Tax=unclassified Nocardia TaxID=2637762 RepID=UPI003D2159EF